jgi:transposase
MAKPTSRPQLSLEAAHLWDEAAGIPEEHWSRAFFTKVYLGFDDAQFADVYEDGGRYPVSPRLLAGITILQYMFKVSDRAAVDNSLMRRDWRVALGRELSYEGFDPSVLCRFRQRLQQAGRIRELFDTIVRRLREEGLVRGRRLRVDATKLIADVAALSRADMIQEAIRIVVHDLYRRYPELQQRPDFLRLHEQYGEEVWLGGGSSGEQKLTDLGRDARALLALCGERAAKGKDVLAQIGAENFLFPEEGEPQPLAGDERPKDHIVTPHEPDVRTGCQNETCWTGDKVHFVETAAEGGENFIVDVVTTDPRVTDDTMLPEIAQRVRFAVPEAEVLLADGGYASAANTKEAAGVGLDLVTRPRANTAKNQISASDFDFDFERQVARCPEGHESVWWRPKGREIQIRFPTAACRACPRRAKCTTSQRGRYLGISKDYEQLVQDRRRAQTPEYAREYRRRAPIEATISQLVHQCGLRRSRYRGQAQREWHALTAATALNVRRWLRCGVSAAAPQEGLGGVLAHVGRAASHGFLALLRAIRGPIPGLAPTGSRIVFAPT